MDDGIMEGHCMLVRNERKEGRTILARERLDGSISIDGDCGERYMTPAQARYLARKLYRLARRIEKRNGQ